MKRFTDTLKTALLAWIVVSALTATVFAASRGEIHSGETHTDLYIPVAEMDYWWFQGDANDRVIITAVKTSGTLNTEIYLRREDGSLEADTSSGGDRLDHRLEQSVKYYIYVQDSGLNKTGTYNISFLYLPDGPVNSIGDPNGGPIVSGETLSGKIDVASDMDAFQFYGDFNDRVIITAVKTFGSLNTEIFLYPPDGNSVEADTSPWGDRLDHQLEQTGLYTIVIHDSGYNDEGDYNISFLNLEPNSPVSSPNDPNGGPIASGETLSGKIDAASDMDAFQFYGDFNDRVIITAVKTSGSLNTEIFLYPPDGGSLEDDTWSGGDRLDHQLERTGLYTIVIHDNAYNNEGRYNISFLKIPGAVSSPVDRDGGQIAPDESSFGDIIVSDMDAFQFYGNAGDWITFIALKISGSLNTEIYLRREDGSLEADTSPWGDSLEHTLEQTGLYTAVVQDSGLNDEGTYKVSLYKIPPDVRPGLYNPCPTSGGSTAGCDPNELQWEAVAGATGYDVYFGTDVNTPLEKIATNIGTTIATIPYEPNHGKIYYWHVVAHTPGGDIAGPWWWFESYILSADFICDGIVNFLDYSEMADYFRQDEPSVDIAPPFGIIDNNDIAKFAEDWLRVELCCQGCL